MPEKQQPESRILERGNIYFVYTPRLRGPDEETDVKGLEDIERTYMVLSVQGDHLYRRIVVGRKRMPDVEDRGERFCIRDLVDGWYLPFNHLTAVMWLAPGRGRKHRRSCGYHTISIVPLAGRQQEPVDGPRSPRLTRRNGAEPAGGF